MTPEPIMSQTVDEAVQLADEPLYEVVDGQRKELEPMGAKQTLLASELCSLLREFAREKNLGIVVNEMLFLLDEAENLQRRPDVAYVSYARWPDDSVDSSAAWNVVPDLAIEVISPTNTADEVHRKLTEYLVSGVEAVWVIHADPGHVYVYDSARNGKLLERADTLDGGKVLPGFELPLETLFAVTKRPD
jgi:Uma2 family endonuclease